MEWTHHVHGNIKQKKQKSAKVIPMNSVYFTLSKLLPSIVKDTSNKHPVL